MRIVLVNSNLCQPPTSPLALDYLGDFVERAGYNVSVLDLFYHEAAEEAIDLFLRYNQIDAIGITVRNLDDCRLGSNGFYLPFVKRIVEEFKAKCNAPVILGGFGFSIMPELTMDYCGGDFGIQGDGERSLVLLLNELHNGSKFKEIPNLIYSEDGVYHKNKTESFDLNEVFFLARNFVENRAYFEKGGKGNIETKRGCNQKCIFCLEPIIKGNHLRLKAPESVTDEIEVLLTRGINSFHFCDSEFNIPEEHAIDVCTSIIRRGLHKKITWEAAASPKPFSQELSKLMKRSGCAHIEFCAESGSNFMLESLGKSFTADDLARTAELCKSCNLQFTYDLLIGGPRESIKTLRKSLGVMKCLPVEHFAFSIGVRVYPNTELERYVRTQGLVERNGNLWGEKAGNESLFLPVFYISEELGPAIIDNLVAGTRAGRKGYLDVLRGIAREH